MAKTHIARFGAVMAALLVLQLTLASRPALAAPGEVIADVATPEGAVLGKGIAFDGRYLYYTLYNGTVLYRIDVPPAGGPTSATGHAAFPITGAPSGINAISYDATRDAIWGAGGDGVSIYLLSKTTGTATLAFTVDPATDRPGNCKVGCSQEINGLAYDGVDDTIWYSPDATMRVYHYHSFADVDGTAVLVTETPYVDVDVPPNDMTPECGYDNNSGVAVGGDHLFLAGGGCRWLFEYTKTGTKLGYIQYSYGQQSPWELECDNVSYSVPVFWAKDGWDGHIRAIEQPAGTGCSYGGVANANPVNHLRVTAPASATAGQPFNVTVTAEDFQNRVVPRYGGTVHFATTDTSPSVALPSDSTLASGQGTFAVTLATAGTQSLTLSDAANSLQATVGVVINAAAASQLLLGASTATPTAGTSFGLTVVAQDPFGNVDTAYANTVHFTSTDRSTGVALPPDSTLASGRGTFSATLVRAGAQTITVSDAANLQSTVSVVINPAPASQLVLGASTATPTAGTSFAVTVVAQDPFGNVDTAYASTVRFTSTDRSTGVVLPPDSTLTNGRGTFNATLVRAGAQTITATGTAAASVNGSVGVTVQPAAAQTVSVQAPASTKMNQAFNITVTMKDRFGNVASGYRGTLRFSTTDISPLVRLPANYAFNAQDAGAHVFSVTLETPPSQTVTATDTVTASLTGTSADIAVGLPLP
jgi:hypothetical protein